MYVPPKKIEEHSPKAMTLSLKELGDTKNHPPMLITKGDSMYARVVRAAIKLIKFLRL